MSKKMVQENAFKILSRWYKTPLKLHLVNPLIPKSCWRCKTETGSFLHVWCSCSLIQPFWMAVHKLISRITTYNLDFTPAQFLLHHSSSPLLGYRHSLTMHLVNEAKMCIPIKWHFTDPPSVGDWFARIQRTMEMKELIHQAKDRPFTFTSIWSC